MSTRKPDRGDSLQERLIDEQSLPFCLDELKAPSCIPPPRIGRDEMNLCEFPFALLTDRPPKGLNTVVFSDRVEGKDKVPVERTWTVTGSDKFGLPIAGDEQIYVALMEVTKEQGFEDRKVYITRYDLVKRLGWPDKGGSYRRLRDGLDRLLGVTITAQRAFWDNAARKYVDVGFHIIDDYALYDEAPGRKSAAVQAPMPLSHITWNSVIFASFKAGNIKQLDTDFYFGLRSAISRRLFRYLDKKRYDGKATFRIGIEKLAFEKLGMSRNYYHSHIRQELRRAHDELCESGYLRGVEYQKSDRRSPELVVYHFVMRRPAPRVQHTSVEAEALAKRLMQVGVTERTALELARDCGEQAALQLDYLSFRRADDPAAVVVEAIRNHWEPPASYLKAQAHRQRMAEEEATARVEEERRQAAEDAEELARSARQAEWDALPEDRRAAIEMAAAEMLLVRSPVVAARPDSAAYKAMLREECWRRMEE